MTEQVSLPPSTTAEQDRGTHGQRHINVMWERTQQVVAIIVSTSVVAVASYLCVKGGELAQSAFNFLTTIAILVISTYFQRTNHTKIGGVGPNEVGR